MDRSIFSRYKRNKRELVLLKKAIEKLENRLEDVPIVNGKVSGSSKNFPYIETHMTVQMVEPKAADEISARLRDKKARRDVVVKEVAQVEAFISKMPDGERKEIFSMFYLDGVSQREIADSVGYTQARVSQIINTV